MATTITFENVSAHWTVRVSKGKGPRRAVLGGGTGGEFLRILRKRTFFNDAGEKMVALDLESATGTTTSIVADAYDAVEVI